MNNLQAGANIAIDGVGTLEVSITWLPREADVDVCAFSLGGDEKVPTGSGFIFGRYLAVNAGYLSISSSSGRQDFRIDLARIPDGIEKIVFAAAGKRSFTDLFDLQMTIGQIAAFSPNLGSTQSLIVGELYRRNGQWKFRAVGQGFQQGLEFLAERYGASLGAIAPATHHETANHALLAGAGGTASPVPPASGKAMGPLAAGVKMFKALSLLWVLLSLIVFIAVELFLGGFVGKFLLGRFIPHTVSYVIEVLMILSSFVIGGVIVGLVSPTVRVLEPAIGAFLCVVLALSISFFSPYTFMGFTWAKVSIGGGLAFFLAGFGACLGEKISAKMGNRNSREYFGKGRRAE
jgi:stress response protein SCP2